MHLLRCSPQYFARKWWESCDIRCSPQCFAPSCKKMVRNGQKGTWDARVNVLKENGRKRWETHPNISHLGGEYLSPILPNLQWTLEVENGKLDSLWHIWSFIWSICIWSFKQNEPYEPHTVNHMIHKTHLLTGHKYTSNIWLTMANEAVMANFPSCASTVCNEIVIWKGSEING